MAWRCLFSHADESSVVRGTLIGAALLAFAVVAFSAYRFASGDPAPAATPLPAVSSREIHTTPDTAAKQVMPPPVAPRHTPS